MLYFIPKTKNNLLTVSDFFASLINVENDGKTVEFEFRYSISQKEVIKYKTYYVDISINKIQMQQKSTNDTNIIKGNSFDSTKIVDNIVTNFKNKKVISDDKIDSKIVSIKSDITVKIDNQSIDNIRKSIETGDDSYLPKKIKIKPILASEIKKSQSTNYMILDKINISSEEKEINYPIAISKIPQNLNYNLILEKGIDPSTAIKDPNIKYSNSYVTSQGTVNGVDHNVNKSVQDVNDYIFYKNNQNFINQISDFNDDQFVNVLTSEPSDIVEISTIIKFDISENGNCNIEFKLIDSETGQSLETIKKNINVYEHINRFLIPSISPSVNVSKSSINNKVTLEIIQNDKIANKVAVFSKKINTATKENNSTYFLIDTFDLKYKQKTNISLKQSHDNEIYRVIPFYNSVNGTAFTNVVSRFSNHKKNNFISITARNTSNGIKVDVLNIPNDVISVIIMRKNFSIFEKNHYPVSNKIFVNNISSLSSIKYVDKFVNETNIYDYKVQLTYLDGTITEIGSETIEHIKEKIGKINIDISNVIVDVINTNVSFDVNLFVKDDDFLQIKQLMGEQGFESYFNEDLSKQKDQIKNLLAYSVERIDLSTGERENLGFYTIPNFDDNTASKKYNTVALQSGKTYRYLVKGLLRKPETLVPEFKKIIVNPINKKKHYVYPYYSHHPISLKTGTIVTKETLVSHYAKNVFEHGEIGSTAFIENVSFSSRKTIINSIVAKRFDKNKIIVNFTIEGDPNQIDHFIISRINNKISIQIDAIHSSINNNICEYFYNINNELGEISFSIFPVYNDYTYGESIISNSVFVE